MNPLEREDIIKLLIKIQLNFENAYTASNDLERELLVESWYEALCEYPKEVCMLAVNNVLKRAKFAPRLGDITEEITKLLYPEAKTDDELWAELNSVLPRVYDLSRYLSYPQYVKWANEKLDKVYSELSEELKLFVVNRSTLVDVAEMSPEALQFERTRFFQQMPVLKKHKSDKEAAQKFIAQTNKAQALLQSNNKK
ncbi:MAG: hypothetical protein K2J61_01130 [Clostridia bacterium]|nr:hypothetical protein [Clostridia bacterium]